MNRHATSTPPIGASLLSAEQLAYLDSVEGREESARLADFLLSLAATIEPEDLENVPTDLSKQVDHYLHGCPRQEE